MVDLPEAVRDLITAQLAESGGGMVTGFYLAAEFIDGDGDQGWMYATPEDQQLSRSIGILEWARGCAHYEQQRYLSEIEGGDDDA